MSRITYERRVEWATVIVEELRDYLPLTLRQLFYQMVSKLLIPNTENQYKGLSKALAIARKEGLLEWGRWRMAPAPSMVALVTRIRRIIYTLSWTMLITTTKDG